MKDTRELERRLLACATDDDGLELVAACTEAAAALAAQRAEIEAMTVILNLCTEGTDWTYAQVPDELASQREELERLREKVTGAIALLHEWSSTELDPMDDEYEPWLESFRARITALSPLPVAPATEKEKP